MKRIFCVVVAAFVYICSYSQGIDDDIYNVDGSRLITTDQEEFCGDHEIGMHYFFPVGSVTPLKYIDFTIEDSGVMEKGRMLLIKFDDNSVMELKNLSDKRSFNPFHSGIQPSFIVSDEQLNKLCTKTVIKVRFEQHDGTLDYNIKKNKFSKILKKCRDVLDAASMEKRDLHNF